MSDLIAAERERLRQLAAEYQVAADKLLEAAAALEHKADGHMPPVRIAPEIGVRRGGRMKQLKEFLKAHGPTRRGAILEGTGIPVGTLGMLLKKGPFYRDTEGRWNLSEVTE
jgi:hypothetical protein